MSPLSRRFSPHRCRPLCVRRGVHLPNLLRRLNRRWRESVAYRLWHYVGAPRCQPRAHRLRPDELAGPLCRLPAGPVRHRQSRASPHHRR